MAKAQIIKTRRYRNIAGPSIRRLRTMRGWTQADLAAKLQLKGLALERADVGKIESQLRSLFDFELIVVATVFGVDLSALDPGEKKMKSELPALRFGRR